MLTKSVDNPTKTGFRKPYHFMYVNTVTAENTLLLLLLPRTIIIPNTYDSIQPKGLNLTKKWKTTE